MNKILKRFFLLLLALPVLTSFFQDKDAGLWMSVNLEKRITPAFSFSLSEELRMYENITEAGAIFSDAGLAYRFGNRFRVEVHYRFINKKNINNTYDNCSRYYADFTYREKLKPLVVLFRLRMQSQYTDVFSSPEGKTPEYYGRTKLTLKLDISPGIRPYIYAEFFFKLHTHEGILFDNMRYCAGLEYSFNRIHMIDLFYMVQQEYNVTDPGTGFIAGIGYYFTIPDLKATHKK